MELRGIGHAGLARPLTPRRLPPAVWLGGLVVLTVLRLLVAARTSLSPDEAYYWVWSRALAAGYLDHPPMVALWIRIGTWIAGPNPLGIRLLGPLSAGIGSVLLWQAGQDLLGGRAGWRAALLLNATLLFGAGTVTMTPDTPLLFFWIACLWAVARLVATGQRRWWLAAGACAGLALCSKYTAALLPMGVVAWLLWVPSMRPWLRRPAPWLGAGLGAAMVLPTLAWNARHGWASLVKQGGRGFVFHPAAMAAHLAELIGGQVGLATPIIFALCVAGVAIATRIAWRSRAAGASLLAALTLPAVCLFVQHALGDRVQPNWPDVIYPGAVLAAGLIPGRDGWVAAGAALGFALTALVAVQGIGAPLPLPRGLDPTLRLSGGYAALAGDAQAAARNTHADFVALDDYGPAALVAFLSPGCPVVLAIEPRWSLFALPPGDALAGRTGVLLHSDRRHDPPDRTDWIALDPVGSLVRARDGHVAEHYTLYRGVFRPGGEAAALLPCRKPTTG